MKILTVVHGFPPESLAGTELVALNLAKSLRARGHDVLVFYRGESNGRAEFDTEEATFEGLRTIRVINNLRRPTVALSYRNQAAERAFVAVTQRFQPEVVHVQHALHLSASLLPVCAAHGWPTVLTLHDYWFICPTVQLLRPGGKLCQGPGSGFACFECVGRNEPGAALLARVGPRLAPAAHAVLRTGASIARRWTHYEMLDEAVALVERPAYMRSALEAADVIVAPSQFLVRVLAANGVDSTRISVCANAVARPPHNQSAKTAARRLRLAFIGTLLPYKGLTILLDALRQLPQDRVELHVHGELEHPESVRAYADAAQRSSAGLPVVFHGRFPHDAIWRILQDTDAVVVPSLWYENAPVIILEAFSSRTPVIASRLGGMAELVVHGVNGLLFEPGNPTDLARQITRLLNDPQELARLSAAAPRIEDTDDSAAAYEHFYAQAIARRGQQVGQPVPA